MRILEGGLDLPDVAALLGEHLADMRAGSPAESVHALDLSALRSPGVTFFCARSEEGELLGVGALSAVSPDLAEVKSMRTAPAARRQGVAAALLAAVIERAARNGHERLALETGVAPSFDSARRLYLRAGFVPCEPFAGYREDPNSAYFALELVPQPGPERRLGGS